MKCIWFIFSLFLLASECIGNTVLQNDMLEKKYDELIRHADELIDHDTNHAWAWYYKGVGHFYLKEFVFAEKSLHRAVSIDYSIADAHLYLGRAFLANDELIKAQLCFENTIVIKQGLSDKTNLASAYSYWALAYFFSKEQTKADSLLTLALKLDSADSTVLHNNSIIRSTTEPFIDSSSPVTWIILILILLIFASVIVILVRWRSRIRAQEVRMQSAMQLYSDIFQDDLSRYSIQDELGRGTMGAVYKAVDTKLNRDVAIKLIRIDGSHDDKVLQERISRFRNEANAIAQLNHPNIVQLYDYHETKRDYYYMVMEYVSGQTLKRAIDTKAINSLEGKVDVIRQIGMALSFAHTRDILHRDVKPSNIMLDENNSVKVLDFGLAKIQALSNMSLHTMTGMLIGTPMYMAPEQITSAKVDQRADIFSLGVVFYELLTNKKPFEMDQDDTSYKLFYKILNEEPIALSIWDSTIPKEICDIVDMMMHKRAQDRYTSLDDFLIHLKSIAVF